MKIRTLFLILLMGLLHQHSKEQSIPFSFYQIPNYAQSDASFYTAVVNPALLGVAGKISASLYSEMPYGLVDIRRTAGSACFPFSSGVFGAHLLYEGNATFSETAFLLQYARKLGEQKSFAGVSFGVTQKRDAGYTTLLQYLAAFGLQLPLSEKIKYGVVMQLRQMQESEEYQVFAMDYQLGIGYRFTPQFSGTVQLNKDAKREPFFYVKAGYQMHKRVLINLVCSTSTEELWAQSVFSLKNMELGISVGFHQMLGLTPGSLIMTK